MICFKDKTFCLSSQTRCSNNDCWRWFGEKEAKEAKEWWGSLEGEPPIAFSDFWDTCPIRKTSSEEK